MLNQFTTEEIKKAAASLEVAIKACRELYLETGVDRYMSQSTDKTKRLNELRDELLKRGENHE